ncbi:hypothetical protein [Pseudalkalibacillus hwajinpoensis]|uniref:hypothetical protein n=1 Tax=Guptibacillus hwajinpoensis TaxID=208199 RepID=UPI001CD36B0D|nr:hypothetical protein [Pseudalkalibacillus hwajinpoensis]MCA0989662.1 hypothetical protein [Pseudalkalibacillus hwajinpoensis]
MKKRWWLSFILATVLLSSCSTNENKVAEIEPAPESEYVKTFDELALGILFDFKLEVQNADERWVKLWVERYQDGKKDDDSVVDLIYGESLDETDEGHVGFGIIHSEKDEPLYFLYAPDIKLNPQKSDKKANLDSSMSTWEYAFKDKKVPLTLDEEKVLAAYRSTTSNEMRTVDLSDPNDVKQMIQEDTEVLLLKILITENKDALY